jgi:uncharacterized protein (DUF983 family)
MIAPGADPVQKGQPGDDRAALFALDGPRMGRRAYPVVLVLTIGLIAAAWKLDDLWHPPLWVHALIWPPVVALVIGGATVLLRKGR